MRPNAHRARHRHRRCRNREPCRLSVLGAEYIRSHVSLDAPLGGHQYQFNLPQLLYSYACAEVVMNPRHCHDIETKAVLSSLRRKPIFRHVSGAPRDGRPLSVRRGCVRRVGSSEFEADIRLLGSRRLVPARSRRCCARALASKSAHILTDQGSTLRSHDRASACARGVVPRIRPELLFRASRVMSGLLART